MSGLFKDRRGLAAVEFALVSVPFMMLIYFILGSGIQLFTYGAMDTAVRYAARQVRIGAVRGTSDTALRNLICTQMSGLAVSCSALQIYATSGASFSSLTPGVVSGASLSKTGFAPGNPGQYVLLQVAYTAPVLMPLGNPLAPTFLSSISFRNEP